MKKITAFLMAVLLIMSGFSVIAAEDSDMERVLGIVKTRIDIPEELTEFTFSSQNYTGKEIFDFNWNNKDGNSYMGVGCDANGIITSYHHYENSGYYKSEPSAKLPKYSVSDCKQIADDFFKKVNPDIYEKYEVMYERTDFRLGLDTYFNYRGVENGIGFDVNFASISINNEEGKVNFFNLNYNEVKEFPDITKAISKADAQKAFGEKIGIQLVYNVDWADSKQVPVLEYIPKGTEQERINAITGEIFMPSSDEERMYASDVAYSEASMKSSIGGMGDGEVRFTPEEEKAIDESLGLLSAEQALNKLRDIKILNIPSDAKIRYSTVNKSPIRYTMNMSLEAKATTQGMSAEMLKLMEASGDMVDYINVLLDAKTGEILSFNRPSRYDRFEEADASKVDEAAMEAAKILLGNKFSEFEIYSNEIIDFNLALSSSYRGSIYRSGVRLNRVVNGVPYMGNQCNIYANPETGFVESFDYSYDDVEFPSLDGVISEEEALNALFSANEFRLLYVPSTYSYYDNSGPIEVSLVYNFVKNPIRIDARTGKFRFDGMEFNDDNRGEYTDIDDHWAKEAINTLVSHGIYFEGTEFRPEDKMFQKDYLTLLTIIFGRNSADVLRDKAYSVYSSYFIGNLVNKEEEAPTAEITRFDAVKFMIRGMGAEEYARLPDIFTTPFNDVTENEGYIALALGLKLIGSNDTFKPNSSITRAEAVCMIYNYLNR